MMPTQYLHRILAIVPWSRCGVLNGWVRLRIDPTGEDWFTPTLSITGAAPATHAIASWACTDAIAWEFVSRVCDQAGIPVPDGFPGWTRQEKKDWLASRHAAILAAIGVYVVGADNDGDWPDPSSALAEMGLRTVSLGVV